MKEECRGAQGALAGEVQGDGPSSEGTRGQNHLISESQTIDKCPVLPFFATAKGPESCQEEGGKGNVQTESQWCIWESFLRVTKD